MTTKQIVKAAKMFGKNTLLPILDTAKLTQTDMTFTDLETEIIIPYNSGITACVSINSLITVLETMDEPVMTADGVKVFIKQGKQVIKLIGEAVENFPCSALTIELMIGEFTTAMLPTIMEAVEFTSYDDLRPAMTTIQVSDHIAATDSHRLLYVPIENPFKETILLRTKVAKLMDIFGGDWSVTTNISRAHITVCNTENIRITYRVMDAIFPQWRQVLPEIALDSPIATLNTKELRKAIKVGAKFGNKISKQGVLNLNGSASYHTEDVDFQMEYDVDIQASYKTEIRIGFNWSLLDNILEKCGETVNMIYFSPTKAAIFEGKYLLMPLVLAA